MKSKINKREMFSKNAIWLVFIAICIGMTFASETFLTSTNIINLLTTESIKGIMAIGIMFAILSKGIDLSVGSILALSAVVSASLVQQAEYAERMLGEGGAPSAAIVGVLAGVAVGVVFGLINGSLIAYARIPAFIATLGSQLVARAIAMLYTNAYPVPQLTDEFRSISNGEIIPGVPNIVLIFIAFVLIGGFLLTQTRFGRNIYAIGGNDQAARVAGINVEKNLVLTYTWCALCAGVGGVLLASRAGSAVATVGVGYELDAIAAATVGGTSHSGGICRLSGVIAGILILGVINNGLLLLGVSPYIQQIVKGVIIVGAVALDMRRNVKKK